MIVLVDVVDVLATDERSYLNTSSDYIPSHDTPRSHKQTMPATPNTRNAPVAPQYLERSLIQILIPHAIGGQSDKEESQRTCPVGAARQWSERRDYPFFSAIPTRKIRSHHARVAHFRIAECNRADRWGACIWGRQIYNILRFDRSSTMFVIGLPQNCSQCTKHFDNKTDLDLHIATSRGCPDCHKLFTDIANMFRHMIKTHGGLLCAGCSHRYPSRITLRMHQQSNCRGSRS